VVFAYHGQDRDGVPNGLLERFESPAARGHRIVHRDHYANPRPVEYLMALVASAASLLCDSPPDLVVDTRFASPPKPIEEIGRIERVNVIQPTEWRRGTLAERDRYANLVLVYNDALGLGCGVAERIALSGRDSVLVINGRRRAFRLTPALRRRLQISRWLADTRAVERALAKLTPPIARALAWADQARGIQ
jgi:hypothetical protein